MSSLDTFFEECSFNTLDVQSFFNKNLSSYVQLEFQRFEIANIPTDLFQAIGMSIASGVRLKFCVRVQLFQTKECLDIVSGLLECKKLKKEQNKIKRIALHRLHHNIRVRLCKYVVSAEQQSFAQEDSQYYYQPIPSKHVLVGIKRMITENKKPIMTFLCSSPSLCSNTQDVIVYTIL